MAGEIRLFRYVRKFYRMVGIYPPSKHQQRHPFDVKKTFGLASTIWVTISILWYFYFEANSTDEYAKGFIGTVSMLECLLYFLINSSKIKSILKLIRKFEDFIESSELMEIMQMSNHFHIYFTYRCQ